MAWSDISCVEQLIERGALDQYRLHVFSEEPMRAYDRVHLSEYFSGRDAESLALGEASLYQTPGVILHLGGARCWKSTVHAAK